MLIADRFLACDDAVVDLAFAQPVDFRRLPSMSRMACSAWQDRCAQALAAGRRGGAILVDYGLLAEGDRFEAYGQPSRRLAKRQAGSHDPRSPSLLPQILDLFETADLGEPRCVRPRLAGSRRAPESLDVIARAARLHGFVPLSLDCAIAALDGDTAYHAQIVDVLRTRHVLLLASRRVACANCAAGRSPGPASICPAAFARAVLTVGVRNSRPNLVVLAENPDADGRRGFSLACRCPDGTRAGARRWGRPRLERTGRVAAEAHESYRVATPDVIRLRVQAAEAVEQARRGRFRRAEHRLREVGGALARRQDGSGAGWVSLSLGSVLLDRGRTAEAARAFDGARGDFDRAHDVAGALRATIHLGLAWTDDLRLAEAEAAFRSARMAAHETGMADLDTDAALALARCLYWQGRFDEASVLASTVCDRLAVARPADLGTTSSFPDTAAVVREVAAPESWQREPVERRVVPFHRWVGISEADPLVIASALAARVALAGRDTHAAALRVQHALDRAQASATAPDLCIAHTAAAAVYGALHDRRALGEHVTKGLVAARTGHGPLRALRLRLLAADALREAGASAEARELLSRLARFDLAGLPAMMRTRLHIVLDGSRATSASTGIGAATIAAACPWRAGRAVAGVSDDIVRLLHVCHEIEDEQKALARVCDVLRERTRAVSATVVGRGRNAPAALARAGSGQNGFEVARRVLDTGLPVTEAATATGLEAAYPVRYGGAVVGALGCRWAADALVDGARSECLMAAAAAAVAPHVRSLLDRADVSAMNPVIADGGEDRPELVGSGEVIETVRRAIARAASAPFPVLIVGESGCGKELVARAIHRGSARRLRPFCALNCAALTEELLESELFGHGRGAFTGAVSDRTGLFEEADGGTLFLDEVADLSPRAQAKLLRAVQEGEVRRVGENHARRVDVRIIAATNRLLDAQVKAGAFRRDLLYRLDVVHIDVPPLRERIEDVPLLAQHFWRRAVARTGSLATLSPATLAALSRYDWPGNVRELQNVMAALAVSAPRRGSVAPGCLPAAIASAAMPPSTLDDARRSFERRFVKAALARAGGHRGRAAASLGLTRQGLAKLLARLELDAPEQEVSAAALRPGG